MTEHYGQLACNPYNYFTLQKAINRILTCSPQVCHREADCFIVARELNRRLKLVDESAGDSLVDDVCAEFQARSRKGQQAYGQKMTRQDLSLADWLRHMKEEMMDGLLYAEASLRWLDRVENDGK